MTTMTFNDHNDFNDSNAMTCNTPAVKIPVFNVV